MNQPLYQQSDTEKVPTTKDLELPPFLRRQQNQQPQETIMTNENARTAEYTPTPAEAEKMAQEVSDSVIDGLPTEKIPTIEEIAAAIRKLTSEIDAREKLRTGLRAKLRKMAGEI